MGAVPAIKVKCPYCDRECDISEQESKRLEAACSLIAVIRWDWVWWLATKVGSFVKRAASPDNVLNEANAWIDMKCSYCGKTYQTSPTVP